MTTPFNSILFQTIPPYTHTYHTLWTSVPPGDPCTIVYRLENQPTSMLTMFSPSIIKMYSNDPVDENSIRTADVVAYFLPLAVPTNKPSPQTLRVTKTITTPVACIFTSFVVNSPISPDQRYWITDTAKALPFSFVYTPACNVMTLY